MWDAEELADFRRRATAAREIAKTIFDKDERHTLLSFLVDCEKMAAANPPGPKPL